MTHTLTDRTIALAGIFQATQLVQQIANTGNADEQALEACIQSLFRINVDKAEDAYGNSDRLAIGLRTLIEQLGGQSETEGKSRDLYISKYAAGIMVLERRLTKNPGMLETIGNGIERASSQVEHFSLLHENVIANLAHIYSQTISTIKPRIMVQGEHVYISNANLANRIRAVLLSAIRSAVLWRQCGGTRWQLLLQRRAIVQEAKRLLEMANAD
ncbi:MAG: high frequency lysogenization protein HflD [Gammaproteobacteria bacterium]|nr:high frequency lysogenization protein HflD [Gammaproteobacteria bacterium]